MVKNYLEGGLAEDWADLDSPIDTAWAKAMMEQSDLLREFAAEYPAGVKAIITVGQGTEHQTTHDASTGRFAPKAGSKPQDKTVASPEPDPTQQQLELEYQFLQQEIQVTAEREYVDMLDGLSEQRADLERQYQQRTDDIASQHKTYVEDKIKLDQQGKETALKHGQDRTDLERAIANEREDQEIRYGRQVRDIKQRAAADGEELASSRDAVGYLKRSKQRSQELVQADQNRQDGLADLETSAERRREALKLRQRQEVERMTRQKQVQMQRAMQRLERQIARNDQTYKQERQRLKRGEVGAKKKFETWAKRLQEDAEISFKEQVKKLFEKKEEQS